MLDCRNSHFLLNILLGKYQHSKMSLSASQKFGHGSGMRFCLWLSVLYRLKWMTAFYQGLCIIFQVCKEILVYKVGFRAVKMDLNWYRARHTVCLYLHRFLWCLSWLLQDEYLEMAQPKQILLRGFQKISCRFFKHIICIPIGVYSALYSSPPNAAKYTAHKEYLCRSLLILEI